MEAAASSGIGIVDIIFFIPLIFVKMVVNSYILAKDIGIENLSKTELDIMMFIIMYIALCLMGFLVTLIVQQVADWSEFFGIGGLVNAGIVGFIMFTSPDWRYFAEMNEAGYYLVDLGYNPYFVAMPIIFILDFIYNIVTQILFLKNKYNDDDKH